MNHANLRKSMGPDPKTVRSWWALYPSALIGIPTGTASDVAVIDCDTDKQTGAPLGEQELAALRIETSHAVCVRTPSGGKHLYFRHVDGARCSQKQLAAHIDVRASGGYVIAPGSILPDGRSYQYEGRKLSEALAAGDLPAFPLDQVNSTIAEQKAARTPPGAAEGPLRVTGAACLSDPFGPSTNATNAEKLAVLRRCLRDAPNDLSRDDWVAMAASLQAGFGEALKAGFVAFSQRYSGSPCDARTAEKAWDSVREPQITGPGPAMKLMKDAMGDATWKAAWAEVLAQRDDTRAPAGAASAPWPDPDPDLTNPARPPAPTLRVAEVLSSTSLLSWLERTAAAKGAPVDYVFAALLVVASGAIGNARWVSPWDGWKHPPTLFAMCIGNPSAGKSPAIDGVKDPLQAIERDVRKQAEQAVQDWRKRAEIAGLAEKEWSKQASKALAKGAPAPKKPDEAMMEPEPLLPRLLVNDATIERVAVLCEHQPRGVIQLRDELAGWLGNMARYSGGGSDRAFWLEAYNDGTYSVDLMGRDPVTVARLAVPVLGGIQPAKLSNLLLKTEDDGLLARLIPIWPEPVADDNAAPFDGDAWLESLLRRLLALDMAKDADGDPCPVVVSFDEDAARLMRDFRKQCRAWEAEAGGLLVSFVGKLPGMAARLALVLAHLDAAAEQAAWPSTVTVQDFGRAAHLVEAYLLPMARRAYAEASVPEPIQRAQRLVGVIRKYRWTHFTSRNVMRMAKADFPDRKALDPALDALLDGDVIREAASDTSTGGRPTRAFLVNPKLTGGAA